MMRWRGRTRWNRKMEARSDAPFSGEVEAGRMSNLYLSVGGVVGVQGLERGPRGHGASKWCWAEQVEPGLRWSCWLADGLVGARSGFPTCTLQLFTRDLAVARSNGGRADEDWGRLAAGDPPLHMAGTLEGGGACSPCTPLPVTLSTLGVCTVSRWTKVPPHSKCH